MGEHLSYNAWEDAPGSHNHLKDSQAAKEGRWRRGGRGTGGGYDQLTHPCNTESGKQEGELRGTSGGGARRRVG